MNEQQNKCGATFLHAIKKTLIVIGIVLASRLVLGGTGVFLLKQSKVQTYIVHVIANKLSAYLDADVSIAHFHYQPLSRLSIDSVYLSDQQRDTLAYIERVQLRFHPLRIRQKRLDISEIVLQEPYINVRRLNDSTFNYDFLTDKFHSDSSNFALRVNIDHLNLINTRVRYDELLVDRLNLDFSMPVFSSDSIDFNVQSLTLRAQLDHLDASFEANLHGNSDSICADEMQLVYRGKRMFAGDIAVFHPTRLDSLYVHADCEDLFCNHALLQDMLSQLLSRPMHLPKPVAALGQIHYKGEVDGRLENVTLRGAFSTALGTLTVNGNAQADTTFRDIAFCGRVSTKRFHLGRLLNQPDLGVIALGAHVDGKWNSETDFSCVADANIQKIEYKGYTYNDIHFDGEFKDKMIGGALSIEDKNVRLHLDGLVDLSEKDTRLDFRMRLEDFRPAAIHLTDKYPQMEISAMTYCSLYTSGRPSQMLDNLKGSVVIDTLDVRNGERQVVMDEMKLIINSEQREKRNVHQVRVQSDFLTASIQGPFYYTTLPSTFRSLLRQYVPSLIGESKRTTKRLPNDLDFYAYFRNIEQITQLLELGIDVPLYPTLKGYVHESDNRIGLQAYVPRVMTSGTWMEDVTVSLDNENDKLGLSVYVMNHLPKNNPTTAKIGDVKAYVDLAAKDDNIDLTVKLDNTDSVRNAGVIKVSSEFQRYADKPLVDVHVHPSNIILNDSAWSIGDAHVVYTAAEKTLGVEHFSLTTQHQSIKAHGMASASTEDSIYVELKNIDVNYLLSYTGVAHALSVDGLLTGWATIYGLFSQPMFEAQATIPNAGLNGVPLGDAIAEAHLNREENTVVITGDVVDSTAHVLAHVDGLVKPERRWELDILCDSVNLAIVNFWTKGILTDLGGLGYGNLHIDGNGNTRETYITAGLFGKDARLTVPQIGATFTFSDSVFLDSAAIRFPHIALRDMEGDKGTFNGILTHNQFDDFRYNMTANVEKMQVMNLPYDPQSMFYGKVYGTGGVDIRGDQHECRISVNARTEPKTKFYLSIATASTASSTSFINFVEADTTSHQLLRLLQRENVQDKKISTKRGTRIILSLMVDVTPTAEINLRMGGDNGLKGRGEGSLRFDYDDGTGNIQLLGPYTLQSGTFAFSLGNIVRRNFDIAEGSRVIWTGDPTSPTVDVTGRYHLTASLRDLYGSEISQLATNRTSVPVNCVLHMTDQLFNPIISFAVELPQSDESVQSQVRSLINTNEMLMRQIIYLLVFNRFYTPDYLQNTKNVGLNETYSLLSSTITGQISSWLSKLTDVFTMGFNVRTDGEGANASQEYEANFQLHPINQLLINGNFGYRYNDLSNRPFFGDLDIEYMLTENGKLRAKAYTHTVDKYSLRQANTVQGVGFVFKHDFNWTPPRKKDRVRNDTTTVPQDTVQTIVRDSAEIK